MTDTVNRSTAIEPIPGSDLVRLYRNGESDGGHYTHAEADRRAAKWMDQGNRIVVEPIAAALGRPEGWRVTLHKVTGLNKGETVLATLCGGPLGANLARTVAQTAAEGMMIDVELKGF